MSYINIDHNKCTGCGECAANCPFGVIHLEAVPTDGSNKAIIGQGCRLCSTCEMVCDQEAIRFISDAAAESSNQANAIRDAEDFHF